MKKSALSLCLALLIATQSSGQQKFPVTSVVDAPTIADRPVALDAQGKLVPWPMPDNIGYSYSSHVLSAVDHPLGPVQPPAPALLPLPLRH